MTIPVTKTKVVLPRRRDEIFPRKRLLDLLYELLDHKLILVTAPAGYGKTSLLVDFAHRSGLPVCWFALDELDGDPERFIAHFIAAIQERFPSFGSQSNTALSSSVQKGVEANRMASTIVNEAYDLIPEHFLIVLDDYHLVNHNKEIDRFLNYFIQYAGENCHLIISSRMLLTLDDLPLMIARSQVGGLGRDELAFTAEEIKHLILRNYRVVLPEAEAQELEQETEGWITGLLLSAQTMWQGMTDRLRLARASGVDLYDYLAQQVLDQQPEELRSFLLQTSLLEEFDAALCRSVFGDGGNWSGMIEQILQRNLFVLPIGEDQRWVRYHHLFRDFLQERIARDDPEEWEKILRNLVAVYAGQGEWEKAYTTCRRLEDEKSLVELVENAGPALLKGGRLSLLEGWIDRLPYEARSERPALLSLKGTASAVQGDVERGLALLNKADDRLRGTDDLLNFAANLVRRADIQRLKGDYQASIGDARQALEITADRPKLHSLYAGALRSIGMGFFQMGQLEEAIEHLARSLEVYQSLNDWKLVAMLRMELGLASMNAGKFRQSLAYYEEALTYWRQAKDSVREATILYNLGVLHHYLGEYEGAATFYEEGLSLAKRSGYLRMEAYTLCGIGDLYADLAASDSAVEAFREARKTARKIDNRLILLYADLAEANQARIKGEFDGARTLLDSAKGYAMGSNSSYENGLLSIEKGKFDLTTGNIGEALEGLGKAAGAFERDGQLVEACRAHLYLSTAYYSAGENQSALDTLAKTFALTEKIESQQVIVSAAREAKELLAFAQTQPATNAGATRLLNQVSAYEQEIPSIRRRLRPNVTTVPFVQPKLFVRALGQSQIEMDGKPVEAPEWQNQKRVREFFFFILSNERSLSKEEIGSVLLPESSPAQLRIQFKNLIYRLRHALGQETISNVNERYVFNRNLDYKYDVEIFQRKIQEARSELDKSGPDNKKRFSALNEAISLYRGPYLADLEGTWMLPERQRLLELFFHALEETARIHMEAREYDRTLSASDRILKEDPCREEAYRLKMMAYAALGNRADVHRQYQLCREVLAEEMNAEPSPQTEALYFKLTQ